MNYLLSACFVLVASCCSASETTAISDGVPSGLKERHQKLGPSIWASKQSPMSVGCPEILVQDHPFDTKICSGPDICAPASFLRFSSLGPVCSAPEYSIWVVNAPVATPKDLGGLLTPWERQSGFFISRPFSSSDFIRSIPQPFDVFVGAGSRMEIDYVAIHEELSVVELSGTFFQENGDVLVDGLKKKRRILVYSLPTESSGPQLIKTTEAIENEESKDRSKGTGCAGIKPIWNRE